MNRTVEISPEFDAQLDSLYSESLRLEQKAREILGDGLNELSLKGDVDGERESRPSTQ